MIESDEAKEYLESRRKSQNDYKTFIDSNFPYDNNIFYMEQRVTKRHIIIHVIDRSGSWYHESRCLSGFSSRLMNRWYKHYTNGKHDEYDLTFKQLELFGGSGFFYDETKYEIINHKSAYKFFEYIDFDYKNKSVKQLDSLLWKL